MKRFSAIILAVLCVFSSVSVFAADENTAPAESEEFFFEAGVDLIDKYNVEIEAKIEEIKNSPTELEITGTTYYVSSSTGNDSNDGLTPATAWKTLEKVNSVSESFEYGTNVLLKRGDTWRLRPTLNVVSGMTLSTYGEGAKPKIICSRDASSPNDWEATEYPNIYKYTGLAGGFETNIGAIVFDGGRAWGIHTSKLTGIYNSSYAGYRLDNGPVFNGLEHYQIPAKTKFEGYKDLKGNLEFYHDFKNESLYLYCKDGNPGVVFGSIELAERGNGIQLSANGKTTVIPNYNGGQPVGAACDIIVDNIHIFGAGSHGIGSGNVQNVTVQNCIFEWIGGVAQFDEGKNMFSRDHLVRFGNAVESYGNSDNFTMYHNYATQVYDCCWTVQNQDVVSFNKIHIYENVAEFANTGSEVWAADGSYVTNMQIHDNYDRYIGYGYSHQRPATGYPIDKVAGGWIGAGSFFYGAGNTGMLCEGNDVYNNVYMIAGSGTYGVAAVRPDKYNFHDNIYIMEEGKKLGSYAPFTGTYRENDITIAKKRAPGVENGTKYYVVPESPLGNMYTLPVRNIKSAVEDFTDIPTGFWGTEAIEYSIRKGLFKGTTATEFSPNGNVTRAQLVTVLSRMAGSTKNGDTTYTDTNDNAWYAQGVYWAESEGIVAAGGKFRPDDKATREELADMLYKYAVSLYKQGSIDGAPVFADSQGVTPAYADGVKFCTKNGIISGYAGNIMKPQGNATRAEAATMIKRFLNYLGSAKSSASPEAILAKEKDAIVLRGQDLKKILDNKYVKATVEADGTLKFVPFAMGGEFSEYTEICAMHAFNPKLDILNNPYAVIKYDAASTGESSVRVLLKISSSVGQPTFAGVSSVAAADAGAVVFDLSSYTMLLDKNTYKNEMMISIRPWDGAPTEGTSFTLKEIIFFDNISSALAYMG